MLVIFGVKPDEGGDGSDFWFGGSWGLCGEGTGERQSCGDDETVPLVAPDENLGEPKYSARINLHGFERHKKACPMGDPKPRHWASSYDCGQSSPRL